MGARFYTNTNTIRHTHAYTNKRTHTQIDIDWKADVDSRGGERVGMSESDDGETHHHTTQNFELNVIQYSSCSSTMDFHCRKRTTQQRTMIPTFTKIISISGSRWIFRFNYSWHFLFKVDIRTVRPDVTEGRRSVSNCEVLLEEVPRCWRRESGGNASEMGWGLTECVIIWIWMKEPPLPFRPKKIALSNFPDDTSGNSALVHSEMTAVKWIKTWFTFTKCSII